MPNLKDTRRRFHIKTLTADAAAGDGPAGTADAAAVAGPAGVPWPIEARSGLLGFVPINHHRCTTTGGRSPVFLSPVFLLPGDLANDVVVNFGSHAGSSLLEIMAKQGGVGYIRWLYGKQFYSAAIAAKHPVAQVFRLILGEDDALIRRKIADVYRCLSQSLFD